MAENLNRVMASLRVKVRNAAPKPIVVPPHLFDLPGVWVCCARRGSGKTTAIASLLRDYKSHGYMDRLWVVSPTIDSDINRKLFEDLAKPEDCLSAATNASVKQVLDQCDEEAAEWHAYQRKYEVWKKLSKLAPDEIPYKLAMEADALGMLDGERLEKPHYKYGHHPRLFLLLDDIQGGELMRAGSKNILSNLAIRNRHVGNGVGLTLIYCVQNYATHSGLGRHIRENATAYFVWRMASEERRLQIAKELSNDIDQDTFLCALEEATGGDDAHTFLTVDMQAPKARRFRKCFDQVLTVSARPQKAAAPAAPASGPAEPSSPPR